MSDSTRDTAAVRIIHWIVPVDDRPHDYSMNGAILHVASRNPP